MKPNRLVPHKGSSLKNYHVYCSPAKCCKGGDGNTVTHKVLLRHKHNPKVGMVVDVCHTFPKTGASTVHITSGHGRQGKLAQSLVSRMFKTEAQLGKPLKKKK